jgi:hypothetical protein
MPLPFWLWLYTEMGEKTQENLQTGQDSPNWDCPSQTGRVPVKLVEVRNCTSSGGKFKHFISYLL